MVKSFLKILKKPKLVTLKSQGIIWKGLPYRGLKELPLPRNSFWALNNCPICNKKRRRRTQMNSLKVGIGNNLIWVNVQMGKRMVNQ